MVGVLVALDRLERVDGENTGIQSLAQRLGIPVLSIVTLDDVVVYLREHGENARSPGDDTALSQPLLRLLTPQPLALARRATPHMSPRRLSNQ